MSSFEKLIRKNITLSEYKYSFTPSFAFVHRGWGRKKSGQRAAALATSAGKGFLLLEDGFLRSVGRLDMAISLVFDDKGIYYDATAPSLLEALIPQHLSVDEERRALSIATAWRCTRLSKYNAAREYDGWLAKPYILVCDQTRGDASIEYGIASEASFSRMLTAALAEYPSHRIVLKIHPDVVTRGKKGHFDLSALSANDRIQIISDPVHPVRLLEHADAVYTVTSQLGFEALIWGKRVRCFGMPFYAGWGLTEDELAAPDRRKPVTLQQLVHAALIKYPHYIDPVTMQRCEVERAIEYMGLQRRKRIEFPNKVVGIGFSRWKRPIIEKFLQGSTVSFGMQNDTPQSGNEFGAVAVWGSSEAPSCESAEVLRIEDGFLRSSGLGADLVRPVSLVIDDVGIYYDATRPSRLEQILQTHALDEQQRSRARRLREKIVELDVSKYNLGKASWNRPQSYEKVLLVVGQVETDASIQLGSPDIKTNVELLQRVRQENPTAYIVYKPHPDVLAGLRRQGCQEDLAVLSADEVLRQSVSIGQLLTQVDEVHTMTSLLGFEALLRGLKVCCHGLPFYAGWGLTDDRLSCSRRTGSLTLDDLVYGALISYPRYFNYDRNCFIEPEQAVEQLALLAKSGPITRSWHRKALRAAIVTWLKLTGSTQ